jgi:hypothetical protein
MEKRKVLPLPELELRPFSLPARSQLICRLRCPGSAGMGEMKNTHKTLVGNPKRKTSLGELSVDGRNMELK